MTWSNVVFSGIPLKWGPYSCDLLQYALAMSRAVLHNWQSQAVKFVNGGIGLVYRFPSKR